MIVIVELGVGNETIGNTWTEAKQFTENSKLSEVQDWLKKLAKGENSRRTRPMSIGDIRIAMEVKKDA